MIPHEPSGGGATGLAAIARRVLRALVALPIQVVSVVRSAAGRSVDARDLSTGVATPRRSGLVGALIGLPFALLANVAALILVFSLGRAISYPFWSAGASPEELDRSWGGPSAVEATLAPARCGGVIVVAYAVILLVERRSPSHV
jgi:hypothetical protein